MPTARIHLETPQEKEVCGYMVEHEQEGARPAMTIKDIADRYRRSPQYVRDRWVNTDEWRQRVPCVGTRRVGLRAVEARVYDADTVEALVREWVWLPPLNSDVAPDQLLDQHAIADYTGFDYATVRSDASPRSNNRLGQPDRVREGVRYWRRSTVDERYWARSRRSTRTA